MRAQRIVIAGLFLILAAIALPMPTLGGGVSCGGSVPLQVHPLVLQPGQSAFLYHYNLDRVTVDSTNLNAGIRLEVNSYTPAQGCELACVGIQALTYTYCDGNGGENAIVVTNTAAVAGTYVVTVNTF